MQFIPHKEFVRCVERYEGERYVKSFSCIDQYLSIAFAQLTYREGLRDIECCLWAAIRPSSITWASVMRCDQNVMLVNFYTHRDYPDKLRLGKYVDSEMGRRFVFLTNNFTIPAMLVQKNIKVFYNTASLNA